MTTKTDVLTIENAQVLRELAGELASNLAVISQEIDATVSQRHDALTFRSTSGDHEIALALFVQLEGLVRRGHRLTPRDVRDGLRILKADPAADVTRFLTDAVVTDRRRRPITPRSLNQAAYVDAMREHDVVFGVGPAGTGKTYLAMAMALATLQRGECERIVLTRPAVEAGEKLGFLPGDLTEKVDPYLRPLYDALGDMIEPGDLPRMLEKNILEIAPLAFMRGRTLAKSFVILDEAQNTTVEQMRMFLTRLGDGGRMVITGDPTQVDLGPQKRSGLRHALKILDGVDGLSIVKLTAVDVVRHPLVGRIIDAYGRDDAAREAYRAHRRAERSRESDGEAG